MKGSISEHIYDLYKAQHKTQEDLAAWESALPRSSTSDKSAKRTRPYWERRGLAIATDRGTRHIPPWVEALAADVRAHPVLPPVEGVLKIPRCVVNRIVYGNSTKRTGSRVGLGAPLTPPPPLLSAAGSAMEVCHPPAGETVAPLSETVGGLKRGSLAR
jgi:hypothetical protein